MKYFLSVGSIVFGLAFIGCAGDGAVFGETFNINDSNAPGASAGAGGTLRVHCEVRNDRSRASVGADGLVSGQYYARIESEGNGAQSSLQATTGDEVEFDFDSALDAIAAGATAIGEDFITGISVTGALYTEAGLLVHSGMVICESE